MEKRRVYRCEGMLANSRCSVFSHRQVHKIVKINCLVFSLFVTRYKTWQTSLKTLLLYIDNAVPTSHVVASLFNWKYTVTHTQYLTKRHDAVPMDGRAVHQQNMYLSAHNFTFRLNYPGKKEFWYPLCRRICGLQDRNKSLREETILTPLPGIDLGQVGCPAICLFTVLTLSALCS